MRLAFLVGGTVRSNPLWFTAYTNDIVGLTQVLVADDGTSQTANLFGLDLVLQDSGAVTRTLLTDGLGSVRAAMVGGICENRHHLQPL